MSFSVFSKFIRVLCCVIWLICGQRQVYLEHHEQVEQFETVSEIVLLPTNLTFNFRLEMLAKSLIEDIVENLLILPSVKSSVLKDQNLIDE